MSEIPVKSQVTYLGITFDDKLSITPHIKKLINKLEKVLLPSVALKKPYLPLFYRRTFLQCAAIGALTYGIGVWGPLASKAQMISLTSILAKATRKLLNASQHSATYSVLRDANMTAPEVMIAKEAFRVIRKWPLLHNHVASLLTNVVSLDSRLANRKWQDIHGQDIEARYNSAPDLKVAPAALGMWSSAIYRIISVFYMNGKVAPDAMTTTHRQRTIALTPESSIAVHDFRTRGVRYITAPDGTVLRSIEDMVKKKKVTDPFLQSLHPLELPTMLMSLVMTKPGEEASLENFILQFKCHHDMSTCLYQLPTYHEWLVRSARAAQAQQMANTTQIPPVWTPKTTTSTSNSDPPSNEYMYLHRRDTQAYDYGDPRILEHVVVESKTYRRPALECNDNGAAFQRLSYDRLETTLARTSHSEAGARLSFHNWVKHHYRIFENRAATVSRLDPSCSPGLVAVSAIKSFSARWNDGSTKCSLCGHNPSEGLGRRQRHMVAATHILLHCPVLAAARDDFLGDLIKKLPRQANAIVVNDVPPRAVVEVPAPIVDVAVPEVEEEEPLQLTYAPDEPQDAGDVDAADDAETVAAVTEAHRAQLAAVFGGVRIKGEDDEADCSTAMHGVIELQPQQQAEQVPLLPSSQVRSLVPLPPPREPTPPPTDHHQDEEPDDELARFRSVLATDIGDASRSCPLINKRFLRLAAIKADEVRQMAAGRRCFLWYPNPLSFLLAGTPVMKADEAPRDWFPVEATFDAKIIHNAEKRARDEAHQRQSTSSSDRGDDCESTFVKLSRVDAVANTTTALVGRYLTVARRAMILVELTRKYHNVPEEDSASSSLLRANYDARRLYVTRNRVRVPSLPGFLLDWRHGIMFHEDSLDVVIPSGLQNVIISAENVSVGQKSEFKFTQVADVLLSELSNYTFHF